MEDLEEVQVKLEDKAESDAAFVPHLKSTTDNIQKLTKKGTSDSEKGVKWKLASFLLDVEKLLGQPVHYAIYTECESTLNALLYAFILSYS